MIAAVVMEGSSFPSEPVAKQVEAGAALAKRSPGASINDLRTSPETRAAFSNIWGKDRKAVGFWSNGHEKVPVEHVIWISPDLISRWLGYLDQREYWEEGELQSRWASIINALEGKKTFIVTLSAYPKMPFHGIGNYKRPNPEEIDKVRFVYTSGEKSMRMSAVRIADWQSRDRKELDGLAWWHLTEFGRSLIGEFEDPDFNPPLPLGDYYRSWYLVTVEEQLDEKFELRVLSRRKERVASFRTKISATSKQEPEKLNEIVEDPPSKKSSRYRGSHRHGPLQQGLVNGLCGTYCDK